MNRYSIAFPFQGEYEYTTIDANQIANILLEKIIGDAIWDLCEEYNQWFRFEFTRGDNKYLATFSSRNPLFINVYKDPDTDDETLIEENIPYIVIKITNGKETILNLSDLI